MSFREYETTVPARRSRIRVAWTVDVVVGITLAMLAFPFPVVRATTTVPVFVLSLLSATVVIVWAYIAITPAVVGRTPGMYFTDLGFEGGRPPISRSWRWALGAMLTFGGVPDTGLASRMSGLVVMSTVQDVGD